MFSRHARMHVLGSTPYLFIKNLAHESFFHISSQENLKTVKLSLLRVFSIPTIVCP